MKQKTAKDYKGYKFLIAKRYFDTGWGLTSYLKYGVALFAIRVPDTKDAILAGLIYFVFCYLLGRWFLNSGYMHTDNEITNKFNPFVHDMRKYTQKR